MKTDKDSIIAITIISLALFTISYLVHKFFIPRNELVLLVLYNSGWVAIMSIHQSFFYFTKWKDGRLISLIVAIISIGLFLKSGAGRNSADIRLLSNQIIAGLTFFSCFAANFCIAKFDGLKFWGFTFLFILQIGLWLINAIFASIIFIKYLDLIL